VTEKKKFVEKMVQGEILDEFKEKEKALIEKLNEIIKKAKDTKSFRIAMLTHDNPDLDAASSLEAGTRFFQKQGVENIEAFAHEESIPPETKAIKEKIGIEIQPLEKFNRKRFKAVILFDAASINQANVKLKNGSQPDLIIDHHNDKNPYGSTATIMTLLMKVFDVEIDEDLATALTAGIQQDTNDLASKKVSKFDRLAFRKILASLVDDQLLKEIVECGYSDSFFEMLGKAISKPYYYQEGTTIITGVGYIKPNQRTDLAKLADFLLEKRSVDKVVVLGEIESEKKDEEGNITAYKKSVIPVVRSSTATQSAGELSKLVFGDERAGGDAAKASGEVPLNDDEIKEIERAKRDMNHTLLEGLFIDILNKYKGKVLEKETK